jgi:predicted GH43/DUF377 family glycosyl hydrolase
MSTRRRWITAIASTAIVAGCSSSVSGSVPPAPSLTPAGPSVATATPAPTEGAHFTFDKDPVVTTEIAGLTDLYLNPGAVIEAGGMLHMFPNSFSKWPGNIRTPHLTSADDGRTWSLDEDADIISSDETPLGKPGIDVGGGYVETDGTWVLLFNTVNAGAPWVIGRATAPGPSGPWTIDDEPVVPAGAAGTFDHGGVQWPTLVQVNGAWVMYYAGFDLPQSGTGAIGMATLGADGTWEKRPDPVMVSSEKWEGRSLDRPRVVSTPNGLVMLYTGRNLTDRGLATSTDGVTWTKLPGPQIKQSDYPVKKRSWDSALLYREGRLVYFLEIGFETTAVYRATLDWPS